MAGADGSRPHRLLTAETGVDFPAWSPDGRTLAYTRYGQALAGGPAASAIAVRDLVTGRDRQVARSRRGQVLDVPRWTRDARALVVGVDRFDGRGFENGSAIAIVDLRARSTRLLTRFDDCAYAPDVDPRTGEIVFSRETTRYARTSAHGPYDLDGIRPDGRRGVRVDPATGRIQRPATAHTVMTHVRQRP